MSQPCVACFCERPGGPNPARGAMVRLRTHSHSGVEVPVRLRIHRPVTEGYCVVATRGGEPPEVNCQSVTKHKRSKGKVNSIQQTEGTSPSGRYEVRAAAQAFKPEGL